MRASWIVKHYSPGTEIKAPNLSHQEGLPPLQECMVIGYAFKDNKTIAIIVEFQNGHVMEIETGYLNEEGGGA